jgi:hypothetical protein
VAIARAAKSKSVYHDRKGECARVHDELAIVLNAKEDGDSSDDHDDDDSDDEGGLRAQIARLVKEAETSARLLATLRDNLRESGGTKKPRSGSAFSISSFEDEFEKDDDMSGARSKVLSFGPAGVKEDRHRRSRSRPRFQKDDDPDAIFDATGKVAKV